MIKKDLAVLDVVTTNLTETQQKILKGLNIITLDEYAARNQEKFNNPLWGKLQEAYGKAIDFEQIQKGLVKTFSNLYKTAYFSDGATNIIFSSGMFGGHPETSRTLSLNEALKEFELTATHSHEYDVSTEILLQGDAIPLSMLAYKDRSGETLLVMSQGHPDAARYYETHAKTGLCGFEDGEQVAVLEGHFSIDVAGVQKVHNPRDLYQKGVPLKIELTRARENGMDNKPIAPVGLESIVKNVENRKKYNKSYTPWISLSAQS